MNTGTSHDEQHLLQEEARQHELELQELLQRVLAAPLQPVLDRTAVIEAAMAELQCQLEEQHENALFNQSHLDEQLQAQDRQVKDIAGRLTSVAASVTALVETLPVTHQAQLAALGQGLAEGSSRGFAGLGAQLAEVDHVRLQPMGAALERVDGQLQQRMRHLEERLQELYDLQLSLRHNAAQQQAALRGLRRVGLSLLALLTLGAMVLAFLLLR